MAEQGLPIIDRTVHETNRWLNEIMRDAAIDDKTLALQGFRAVMVTLRDTMPVDLATNLGDQLPVLVRGLYYENYVPSKTPHLERTTDAWAASVAESGDNIQVDQAMTLSRAVYALLRRELDANIVDKVSDAIPQDLRVELMG
ncbi:DUF2267 domain-containing protein [uncultured Salinisphaera sp.]|uniref:DUF2267 domain-containing protein n=1 Tax=uncultured Salinisphaera sp. TaxID=359372 RepID=UPI0032B19957|tara:strand:- start:398 stop:826 length:429 start_codon:yes stop_codon:yes gene_type:complete